MSTEGRKPENESDESQLGVEDLNPQTIEASTAEQVKGGFTITKTTDAASPVFFQNASNGKPTV